jgi:hypothetical protein
MSSSLFSLNLDKLLRDFHEESELNDTTTPMIARKGNHFTDCRKAAWQLTAPRWRTSHNLCEWIEGSSQKAVTDLMEEIHQFCSLLAVLGLLRHRLSPVTLVRKSGISQILPRSLGFLGYQLRF